MSNSALDDLIERKVRVNIAWNSLALLELELRASP